MSLSKPTTDPREKAAPDTMVDPRVWWTAFLTAFQFLTRIPISLPTAPTSPIPNSPVPTSVAPTSLVPSSAAPTSADWNRSLHFFPLVGVLIGIWTALLLAGGGMIWPVAVAVAVALLGEIAITGGLHEDGVADCCDAFGHGGDRETIFRILKDSRLGTFGLLGLLGGLGLKYLTIVSLVHDVGLADVWRWVAPLVAAAAWGRLTMVAAMHWSAPVENRPSLAQHFQSPGSRRFLPPGSVMAGLALIPMSVIAPASLIVSLGFSIAGTWVLHRYFHAKLGGSTGDCLGCLGYVSQVLFLLGAIARLHWEQGA